jgi:hypothetical protein
MLTPASAGRHHLRTVALRSLAQLHSAYFSAGVFVGLRNYVTLLADPYFWRAFWNTFWLVNVIVYLELALGLGIALLFASGVAWPRLMIAAVVAPYAMSEVVTVVMWKYLFQPDSGPVNWLLGTLGFEGLDWTANALHAFGLIVLLAVWHHLPFTFLILYTGRLAIPQELYESALVDGAAPGGGFATSPCRCSCRRSCGARVTLRVCLPRSPSVAAHPGGRRARPKCSRCISTSRHSATASSAWPPPPVDDAAPVAADSLYFLRIAYRRMFAAAPAV